jgi:hypothetical protein
VATGLISPQHITEYFENCYEGEYAFFLSLQTRKSLDLLRQNKLLLFVIIDNDNNKGDTNLQTS